MAERLPAGCKLYAVDTWLGSVEHQDTKYREKLPSLYAQFLSNVIHAGLQEKIEPVRLDSLAAAKELSVKADLIFIDAAHDTESVYKDIMAWYPHLKEGGVICGDDWTWASVRLAVEKAAKELDADLVTSDSFWYFAPSDHSLDFPALTTLNLKGKWRYFNEWRKGKR